SHGCFTASLPRPTFVLSPRPSLITILPIALAGTRSGDQGGRWAATPFGDGSRRHVWARDRPECCADPVRSPPRQDRRRLLRGPGGGTRAQTSPEEDGPAGKVRERRLTQNRPRP